MIELTSVKIVNAPRLDLASVRLCIPRSRIGEVMGPSIGAIFRAISEQSIPANGPVLSHHFRIHPDVFDFEVAVPVEAPIVDDGEVKASVLPACRIASAIYSGAYEQLGAAWAEFESRLDAMNLRRKPNIMERYIRGPESELPPSEWMTELCHVLDDFKS